MYKSIDENNELTKAMSATTCKLGYISRASATTSYFIWLISMHPNLLYERHLCSNNETTNGDTIVAFKIIVLSSQITKQA